MKKILLFSLILLANNVSFPTTYKNDKNTVVFFVRYSQNNLLDPDFIKILQPGEKIEFAGNMLDYVLSWIS